MNNEEARFRLTAYRPGGDDAADPEMAEALRQARQDPSLGAWHARELAFDAAVAAKLREVAPPPGLREAILAGGRVSTRRPWWRSPAWLAAAASLAVALGAGTFLWRGVGTAGGSGIDPAFAFNDVRHGHHTGMGGPLAALQATLGNPSTRLGGSLPIDAATLKADDCRSLDVAGRQVFEFCFMRQGHEFHLYVAVLGADVAGRKPAFESSGELASASWSDARYSYVLVGNLAETALRQMVRG